MWPLPKLWILTVRVVPRAYIFVNTPLHSTPIAAPHCAKVTLSEEAFEDTVAGTWRQWQEARAAPDSPVSAIHWEGCEGGDLLTDRKQQVRLETRSGATRQMKPYRSVSELYSQGLRFQTGKFSHLTPHPCQGVLSKSISRREFEHPIKPS